MRQAENSPICGCIVAVIDQEVVVQFHKDVQCDPAVRSQDIVISLLHHTVKVV